MNYIALGFISLFGLIGLSMIHADGYQNLYSNYGMPGYGQGYGKGYSQGYPQGYGSSGQALYIPYPYYTPNYEGYGGVSGGGLGGGSGDEPGIYLMFFLLIFLLVNNNNSG